MQIFPPPNGGWQILANPVRKFAHHNQSPIQVIMWSTKLLSILKIQDIMHYSLWKLINLVYCWSTNHGAWGLKHREVVLVIWVFFHSLSEKDFQFNLTERTIQFIDWWKLRSNDVFDLSFYFYWTFLTEGERSCCGTLGNTWFIASLLNHSLTGQTRIQYLNAGVRII